MKTKRFASFLSTLSSTGAPALAVSALVLSAVALRAEEADRGYVAHEWGTFTSIQGGDGVLLNWNGIATSDLPGFVYDWQRAGVKPLVTYLDKGTLSALQRMETPVIYFYTKQPVKVDVSVRFPRGRMTEWFPRADEVGPSIGSAGGQAMLADSVIRWKDIAVLPVGDHSDLAGQIPMSPTTSHYFAARATDSAFVRLASLETARPAPEIEKFLFYRGVGNFPTPLKVLVSQSGTVTVTNTGNETLKHLFAVSILGDRASVKRLGHLQSGQSMDTSFASPADSPLLPGVLKELRRQMADALEAEGLYRAEAEAMVETWRDAWFEDQGVRILYVLPRVWTDTTLPITLNPPPRELVRVMIGRAEVITPAMVQRLARCVEGFRQSDPAARQAAIAEFRDMKLGRFAHAALGLACSLDKEAEFFEQGKLLIKAAEASGTAPEPARRLAAKGG